MWAADDARTNEITSRFYDNIVDESGPDGIAQDNKESSLDSERCTRGPLHPYWCLAVLLSGTCVFSRLCYYANWSGHNRVYRNNLYSLSNNPFAKDRVS